MRELIIPSKTEKDYFSLADFQSDLNGLNSDISTANDTLNNLNSVVNTPKTYIRLYLNANKLIYSNTWTTVPFVKQEDTNNEWSDGNNSFVVRDTGIYQITYNQLWSIAASGTTVVNTVDIGTTSYKVSGAKWGTGTNNCSIAGSITVRANAGETINFKVYTETKSAATDTILGTALGYTWATITRIR